MSDLVVVPTTPDVVALNTLMRFIEDLEYVDARAEYRVLLTLVPRWPSRAGARARAALEEGGVPIFEGQVRQRAAFQWAGELGVPVYEVNERRALQGWEDYERVGREVIGKQ
jgi:chromosome partitioning protein